MTEATQRKIEERTRRDYDCVGDQLTLFGKDVVQFNKVKSAVDQQLKRSHCAKQRLKLRWSKKKRTAEQEPTQHMRVQKRRQEYAVEHAIIECGDKCARQYFDELKQSMKTKYGPEWEKGSPKLKIEKDPPLHSLEDLRTAELAAADAAVPAASP